MAESEYKTEYTVYDPESQQPVTVTVSGEDEAQQAQQVQYITQDGVHILPSQLASGTPGVIQVCTAAGHRDGEWGRWSPAGTAGPVHHPMTLNGKIRPSRSSTSPMMVFISCPVSWPQEHLVSYRYVQQPVTVTVSWENEAQQVQYITQDGVQSADLRDP